MGHTPRPPQARSRCGPPALQYASQSCDREARPSCPAETLRNRGSWHTRQACSADLEPRATASFPCQFPDAEEPLQLASPAPRQVDHRSSCARKEPGIENQSATRGADEGPHVIVINCIKQKGNLAGIIVGK